MKDSVKNILIIGLKLFVICVISGTILSIINGLTEPAITARQIAEEKAALQELFPGGEPGKKEAVNAGGVVSLYKISQGGSQAGYILELQGNGYGGAMKILASYKNSGEVINVKLMDNEETPGLGKLAEAASYMKKFIGKGGSADNLPIPVTKEMLAAQQAGSGAGEMKLTGFTKVMAMLFGQSGGSGDSVTGATITFSGVSNAVAEGSGYVKNVSGGVK